MSSDSVSMETSNSACSISYQNLNEPSIQHISLIKILKQKASKSIKVTDCWSAEMQASSTTASLRSPLQAPDTLWVILASLVVVTAAELTQRLVALSTHCCHCQSQNYVKLTKTCMNYVSIGCAFYYCTSWYNVHNVMCDLITSTQQPTTNVNHNMHQLALRQHHALNVETDPCWSWLTSALHRPQTTCLHPALSCAAGSIFLHPSSLLLPLMITPLKVYLVGSTKTRGGNA